VKLTSFNVEFNVSNVLPLLLRLDDIQTTEDQDLRIRLIITLQRTQPMKGKGKGYSTTFLYRDRVVGVVVLLQPIDNVGTRREWEFSNRRPPY